MVLEAGAAARLSPYEYTWENVFFLVDDDGDFDKNSYGISEPKADNRLVVPDEKTLVLVPGLAMTIDGQRLGYGGGYYDRYLSSYPTSRTVGVVFREQVVKALPCSDFDQKLKKVLYF